MTRHLFIPDTQVKPGVPISHLEAVGNLIVDMKPDVVVHIGDHWDMPSLSSYEDRRSAYFHDKTYCDDIEAGLRGMDLLLSPLRNANNRARRNRKRGYFPRLVFTLGNHEHRIRRAVHADPRLRGTVGYHDLKLEEMGWEVHDFLDIVEIDGILYCLHPDHKVLMSDFYYKRLGDVVKGDKLLAFDEYIQEGRARKYRNSEVEKVEHDTAELYEVTDSTGKVFTVTKDHRWLVRQIGTGYVWATTDELREGTTKLLRVFPEYETDTSYEAGYIAGVLDGEGHVYSPKGQGGLQVGFAQRDNACLSESLRCLDKLGIKYSVHNYEPRSDVRTIRLSGTTSDKIAAVKRVGAKRLEEKFSAEMLGNVQSPDNADPVYVETVKAVGRGPIVRVQTSTRTMIVEGYAHHNCHYFCNPLSLKKNPLGGTIENRLQKVGQSFSMGHQQIYQHGMIHDAIGRAKIGLVWGTFYQHDEDYAGPQGNHRFDGVMIKNEVRDGFYCGCPLSMDYLLRNYL